MPSGGVRVRFRGRVAGWTPVGMRTLTSRGTGVSPVVNPANGAMETSHGQDAHATKIRPHPSGALTVPKNSSSLEAKNGKGLMLIISKP
jgi:hypothetical protein